MYFIGAKKFLFLIFKKIWIICLHFNLFNHVFEILQFNKTYYVRKLIGFIIYKIMYKKD